MTSALAQCGGIGWAISLASCLGWASQVVAANPMIHFDLPAVAVAQPVDPQSSAAPVIAERGIPVGTEAVSIELRLSSMIAVPNAPNIDQWLVRCQPRDRSLRIADYAPRTELEGAAVGPVNVKRTDESNQTYGISLDGSYGHVAHGRAGADVGQKSSETLQFERAAPVHAVVASGTVDRGRGVYYKLRWTSQQVLEGEKTFRITLLVPSGWRGGLVDVSVVAQREQRTLGGLDREVATLGAATFSVAVYRQDDLAAQRLAMECAAAEDRLRAMARQATRNSANRSIGSLLHQVVGRLDFSPELDLTVAIDRILRGQADPHVDKQLRQLPMEFRTAALDYCDLRDEVGKLGTAASDPIEVAERTTLVVTDR